MKKLGLSWLLFVAVAGLAISVVVVGWIEKSLPLMAGGLVFVLLAACFPLWSIAMRPGPDGGEPSRGEKVAWTQMSASLGLLMLLCAQQGLTGKALFAPWLWFFAFVLVVLFRPFFRRRLAAENLSFREVAADERDAVFQAKGERLSKRLLEITLVMLAIAWLLFADFVRALHGPMQIAAVLFAPVFVANIVGDARIAYLYWRDRQ